jgi:hypothetical protein
MEANVQGDRFMRLFTGMSYGIWAAVESADHEEAKEGRGPMNSAEIVSALAAAVGDQLGERGIEMEQFLAKFPHVLK